MTDLTKEQRDELMENLNAEHIEGLSDGDVGTYVVRIGVQMSISGAASLYESVFIQMLDRCEREMNKLRIGVMQQLQRYRLVNSEEPKS